MNLLILAVIVVVVAGVLAALKGRQGRGEEAYSFEIREPFLSPAERSFLGVLEQAAESRHRIFGKVRLGDLVKPAKGLPKSKRTTARNKVNQKHVDFVLCRATDLKVVGVVELDDQSHARQERVERDGFVDHALKCAGIPIARFSAKHAYQVQEVRAKLVQAFNLSLNAPTSTTNTVTPPQPTPEDVPAPTSTPTATPTPTIEAPALSPAVIEEAPTCGKCGSAMVKRQAKKGPHAGKLFWACTAFPKCRQVVPS